MRIVTQALVVVVLAAGGAGAWYYTQQKSESAPQRAAPQARAVVVEVVRSEVGTISDIVEAVGSARANEAVTLTPKVGGLIRRFTFTEGQRVKAGQVVVELDSNELEAKLQENRALRENTIRQLERAQRLLQMRSVAQAKVDDLEAQLSASNARIMADEARLADYSIRAPFEGKVGLRRVSVGAMVTPGVEIATLDDTTSMKVDFRVPESALRAIKVGTKLEARTPAYPGRTFPGTVTTIGTRVDPATRSVELRADLPNRDDALKPGMFMTASLIVETRDNAVLVPEEAVVSAGERHIVYTVVDGKAKEMPIAIGQQAGGKIEIRSGLPAGTTVIVGGVLKIRDGVPVRPGGTPPAGAPGQGPPARPTS
ncbi:MAG: efflux RND transporter periplasmic adaptor subunit [Alphaproteobacteria bacterium]|nr:efflux RND transporter periplasmic adaptor subunit [Alphaproteobacteria bacterium]